MIVASGFIEANEERDVAKVVADLATGGMEVTETTGKKVVFLIERKDAGEVKAALDSLKHIDEASGIYLAYYSIENRDGENGQAGELPAGPAVTFR